MHDLLDVPLLRKLAYRNARERAADFQPLDENGRRDVFERRHLLIDAFVRWLVKRDGMLRLVLHLALRPLLLGLGLSAA